MKRRLKLMPDYDCWPIWDMDEPGNVDPETLSLPSELIDALNQWQATYDATLVRDDPRRSGFPSDRALEDFTDEGRGLAERLQKALPGCEIWYFDSQRDALTQAAPMADDA